MSADLRPGFSRARSNLALAALFLGAFVMGSAELIVVGILNLIADDMGVSISAAGSLVTTYALGISIGGPLLTAVTIKFARKQLLQISLAAYVLGNVLAVVAGAFGLLLAARVLTGSLHGLFIGVAFAVGTGMMPPEKMGKAISFVFGGVAVSTALGVPLGTLVGQVWGWQASFVAIIVTGVLALVLAIAVIPPVPNSGLGGFGAQARHALAPKVLAMLGLGFLLMGGQFAGLTYLQPFLSDVTGVSGGTISIFLLVYGIANAVGTFLGGAAADRNASGTIVVGGLLVVAALVALYVAGSNPVVAAVALGVWGVVGFGIVPSIQYRVVGLAGPGRDFAATLPASAITAGIAVGALIGAAAVAAGGARGAVLTSLVICSVGVVVAYATSFLKPTPEAGPDVARAVAGEPAPTA
ncbi:MFS transporter [Saccharothrix syringae]|uniref:MFS transporter n=1 Tax=Saccharothrix syringae TaxID=103733 RepID=A0A5Q0H6W6_SACSY|nr:MFS transporter [Saccharothrix syringae]QFZ21684.1 MFS transporter [Saccharothrix syringae]